MSYRLICHVPGEILFLSALLRKNQSTDNLIAQVKKLVSEAAGAAFDPQAGITSMTFATEADRSHLLLRIVVDVQGDAEAIVKQLNQLKGTPSNSLAVQGGYFFRHPLGGRTQYTPVGVGGPGKLIDLIELAAGSADWRLAFSD